MVNKYIRNGEVAVLYSPGFGAGWSTWNSGDGDKAEFMMYDSQLVECVLNDKKDDIPKILEKQFPGQYVCILGLKDLRVGWLRDGTAFRITKYDGSESVETIGDINFSVA